MRKVFLFGHKGKAGEGNGSPLQYSCLGNSMDRGPGGPQGCKVLDTTAHTHPKHKGKGVMEDTRGNDQV